MFVLPHSIRHLFKTINIQVNSKQLTLQNLGSFKHFNISEATQKRLKVRNVECLFPVQYRSYNDISSGKDCIVQAHTGTVLEPTRELAKQVT
ncbi:unnamed protein product, partial [Rotaria socialis]